MSRRRGLSLRTVTLLVLAGLWLVVSAGPALADNCGTPADCFGQAGSFNLAALGLLALAAGSLLLDFVPVVGTAKGVVEAILGRDLLTGQELSWWERGLGVLPGVAGLASVAGVVRAADRAADLGSTVGDVRRVGEAVGDVRTRRVPDLPDHPGVRDYTGDGYLDLNPYLRGQGGHSPAEAAALQARADRVSRELVRLPAAPGTTYRGTNLPDDVLAGYQPGRVVTERAFMSTSRDPGVAQGVFDGNTLQVVTGRNGRDVAPVSFYPGEAEILYDRGTRFLVTDRTWDAGLGKWLISLEEIVP